MNTRPGMSLLTAWHDWKFGSPPFFLAGDEVLGFQPNNCSVLHATWESLTGTPDFGAPDEKRFHLSLVPVPFIGDVEHSKIVILLQNPGLDPADYFGEFKVPGFRARLIDNLRQDFSRTEYPFVCLDPDFSWHSGYRYWHEKLQGIIAVLAEKWHLDYADARLHMAKIIACIELVSYHSVSCSRIVPAFRQNF
jgi:hypothetical protein